MIGHDLVHSLGLFILEAGPAHQFVRAAAIGKTRRGEAILAFREDDPGNRALKRLRHCLFARLDFIEFVNPLDHPAPARMTVHDLQGRQVALLFEGTAAPGPMRTDWNGLGSSDRLPAGAYFVRVELDGHALSRRVVYLP